MNESRRERGRIAQREYRKRHASTFRSLQDENKALKDTLRDIIAVAGGQWVSPALEEALTRAKAATGIADGPTTQPGTTTTPLEDETPPDIDHGPNLNQGVVNNGYAHSQPDTSPSAGDLASYLGDRMFTLAGRLFWDYMTHVVLQLQKLSFTDLAFSDNDENAAFALAHSMKLTDGEYIVTMAKARLDYHQATQRGAGQRSDTARASQLADRDRMYREGRIARQSDMWKTPDQVAEYLLQRLRPHDAHTLLAAVEGRASPYVEKQIGIRLYPWAKSAVCLGDGPRWNLLFLSLAVGSWVSVSETDVREVVANNP